MKKLFTRMLLVVLIVFAALTVQCLAAKAATPNVTINGQFVDFDVPPVIEDGRTLVPIRAISEKFNYNVLWDGDNRKVEITDSSNVIISDSIIKNNKSGKYSSLIGSYNSEDVHFKNCEFKNNDYIEFSTNNVYFQNCTAVDN